MTCLWGNTETRAVFDNFQLQNLHANSMDPTHLMYQRYLEEHFFVPPGDTSLFFNHYIDNNIPAQAITNGDKGFYNVFPLSLLSNKLDHTPSSNLGNFFIYKKQ